MDSDDDGGIGSVELDGLKRAQRLVASLHDRAGPAPAPLLQEAIAELETTLEELAVAVEELHEQHDELVNTRAELEAERQYFQELFDLAPEAYLLTDENGIVRDANRAALRLLGSRRDHLLGRPLDGLVRTGERAEFRTSLRTVIASGGRRDWTFGLVPLRRSPVLVAANVTVGRAPHGTAAEVRWQLRDITDARQAQELLQARFTQSRQEAESLRELDRWKDAFMAAAAHDLRTPLAVIDAAARTLQDRPDLDAPTRDRLLDSVTRHAGRLQRLLDDLLDLDRFTRGVVRAERRPVDVGELVSRTVGMLDVTTHPVDVETVHVVAELDVARVEQIVANLVGNAVNHTLPGTPVHVRARAGNDQVILVVEDEGPGLDAELGDRIFHPFVTQARQPGARESTGLGLSLVALFAELHGGTARAQDRPGGGARFVVELPATIHGPDD